MATKKYSFRQGVGKTLLSVLIFAVPVLFDVLPAEWLELTVGGLLTLFVNFLKFKASR